ncbi:MAG: DUF975 family protein [Evtepia sp.]
MKQSVPLRYELKQRAKKKMGKSFPNWIKGIILFVALEVGFVLLQIMMDATIPFQMFSLQAYANVQSGIFSDANGLRMILRMDVLHVAFAIPLTYERMQRYLFFAAMTFLVVSPMKLGAMEQCWWLQSGQKPIFREIFRWYYEWKRLWKALVIEGGLGLVWRAVGILFTLPTLILYSLPMTFTPSQETLVILVAWTLMFCGVMLSFFLYTVILPIRYCLSARPELSIVEIIKRGLKSTKGYRREFFKLRFSFVIWDFVSNMSYGAMDLYVFPYISVTTMEFLAEVRNRREGAVI